MTLKCYLARPHERQAEEIAARTLARELLIALDPAEPASLAFNLRFWGDCQVDALLITSQAVTVIDWKDALGPIEGGETGPWLRDGQPLLAGSSHNPYQQIRRIRNTVAAFIRKNASEFLDEAGARFDPRAFHHVGAVIVFTPIDPEKNITLSSATRSWLVITGLDIAAAQLVARRSDLNLLPHETDALIEQGWGCRRWAALEAILPERPVGTLWQVHASGERQGWLVTRALTLGRGTESTLRVEGAGTRVSRRHAHVHVAGGEAVLYDLGSRNGTFLNGKQIDSGKPYVLADGDVVSLAGPPDSNEAPQLIFTIPTLMGDEKTTTT